VRIDENLKRLEKRKKARDKRAVKRAAKRASNAPPSTAPAQPSLAQMMTEAPPAPGGPMPGLPPKGEA
jgi:small subunit ribosomal protein S6